MKIGQMSLSEVSIRSGLLWEDVLIADMKRVNLRPDDTKLRCMWRAASHVAELVPKRDYRKVQEELEEWPLSRSTTDLPSR